jgi:alpha-L-fucosidase
MKRELAAAFLALAACAGAAPQGEPRSAEEALARWQAWRFGMFIHWGPVAIKGTEIGWSRGAPVPVAEYDQLYKQFNPVKFDADAWAKAAKDAGMKYLVLTSKHHDGFCLWPSKVTDYHIGNSPFKRDVCKELAAACRKHGVQFCTYYSVCDWYHPDYPLGSPGGKTKKPSPDMPKYCEFLKAQMKELIENYGPLGVLWFDGEWEQPWTREHGNNLYAYLKKLQPSLLVNNRVSKGRHGMAGTTKDAHLNAGDFDTPEQEVGKFNRERPWESCITICNQWAWKPNDRMKTTQECLRTLITCAGGDGNLLFNVGPTPEGEIEARQVARLMEMGAWLKKCGESIYGTRGGPFKPGRWGASTHKGNTVYLHVYEWDGDGITVAPFGRKVKSCRALTGGEPVLKQTDESIRIALPEADRQAIDTVLALELDGPAGDISPRALSASAGSLTAGAKATASNVYQNSAEHGADRAVDGNAETRWATDAGTKSAWLEVDLGKPAAIGSVAIRECVDYGPRVKKFEVQVKEGDAWKTVIEGGALGADFRKKIAAVTTRHVRLNILEAGDGPTIWEFELFPPKGGS